MPATYAHTRFGNEAVTMLSGETGRAVRRFRGLFDAGSHGPDFLFYHIPIPSAPLYALGHSLHTQSGQTFFGNAVKILRQNPSEGGRAYLFGVLAHYALDSVCHPMVHQASADGKIGHTELETEFDRYLLRLDGEESPHTRNLGGHLSLTRGECETIAEFYPTVSGAKVSQSFRRMQLQLRLLAIPNRRLVEQVTKLTRNQQSVMPQRTNRNCSHWDEPLLDGFHTALSRYPILAAELDQALESGDPLGEAFAHTFG